ncbi:hypothetical protein NBRC111893_1777 [Lentilactobacillus kosonis]|uniref:Uncharacterized protein n=1 Tax=Lentilactobacillus kosonis TaxID=2810561 RepID=A0A401FN31_9LACO|nr:hypothetical protein NBRC111893_1777 [Lentilactobacillus kosonis]
MHIPIVSPISLEPTNSGIELVEFRSYSISFLLFRSLILTNKYVAQA